jgi:hypothetical protein
MLTQKTKEVPYIGVFKTQAGEEFIGKVIEETMISYTVQNALCMVPTEKGLQFAPFMFMADSDKGVVVPKPMIAGTPPSKLEEQYKTAVSPIARVN